MHTISAFVPYHTFPSVQLLIESCSIADQEANNKEHTKRQFNIILEILLTFSVSHVNVTSVLWFAECFQTKYIWDRGKYQ